MWYQSCFEEPSTRFDSQRSDPLRISPRIERPHRIPLRTPKSSQVHNVRNPPTFTDLIRAAINVWDPASQIHWHRWPPSVHTSGVNVSASNDLRRAFQRPKWTLPREEPRLPRMRGRGATTRRDSRVDPSVCEVDFMAGDAAAGELHGDVPCGEGHRVSPHMWILGRECRRVVLASWHVEPTQLESVRCRTACRHE